MPKSKNILNKAPIRILLIVLLLLLLGGELVRRAVYGQGHVHALAKALYLDYREYRSPAPPLERADDALPLYTDKLGDGWQDWSWAAHSLSATANVYSGSSAIEMTPEAFKGIYLHHDPLGIAGYGSLRIYIYGRSALTACLVDEGGKFGTQIHMEKYVKATAKQGWSAALIPLADLGARKIGFRISGIAIQAAGATKQPDVFLDEISLLPDQSLPAAPTQITVAVTVDPNADRHPISPYIYGMAFAPSDYLKDLRLGSNRWGGNDKSRYNWVQGNAVNAARDWRWANRVASGGTVPPGPSAAANQFVMANRVAGAATVLTVPTIGFVARDSDNANTSLNVPNQGGPPLAGIEGAIAGYDPSDNRRRTSVRSVARKGAPFTDLPTMAGGVIYQDEWVHHLVRAFGSAAAGGVRFYAMDNEPDIWDFTHTDVHPARMGYDDMLANFLEYASAVKAVDPTSEITGPVLSGWTSFLYSSLDRGGDNFHTHADCTGHGGEAFILWFLKHVKANDARTGKRSLDVLDVHYYPQGQGIYGGAVDKDTQERRIRSTRGLWDPDYADESWIGEPVRLIPRLKEWISTGYPGTKIGITEWNYGADKDMSGAVAIADALGIYGREDLYLANYWAYPAKNSPGYLAFRLFRNADGHRRGFGDTSCRAVSADPGQVSCFAAADSVTKDLTILLINKTRKATASVPIAFKGASGLVGAPEIWQLSSAHPDAIVTVSAAPIRNGSMMLSLPPYSISLVRIPAR